MSQQNHSCDPNCHLLACYINEADIGKPLLTFFAKKDIRPGEELTFSYNGNTGDDVSITHLPCEQSQLLTVIYHGM